MKNNLISKIFILALLSCLISKEIKAEETNINNKVTIDARIGINNSNVWDTEGEEFKADSKIGLVLGANISIPILRVFEFQPGLFFSQKGFDATGKVLGANYNFKRTLNFLDIPLLVGFRPIDNVTILLGPQYSYLMSQKDEFLNPLLNVEQQKEFDNANIRDNMLCVLTGFDVKVDHFVFGARLGWDLTKNNGDGTSSTPRYKNTWTQFTVGFSFD